MSEVAPEVADEEPMETIMLDITPETEYQMTSTGFATRNKDGVLEITHRGSEFIKQWCRELTEAHARP